jgi:DNA (cytosine-5)-methyltransferase 1
MTLPRPTALSLFSGIGGLDLGLQRAGWRIVGQVENDPYCIRVLAKHWPDVPRWGDIREVDTDDLPQADLIAGGFPCQPVSAAGKRLGQDDPRWLWPEAGRLVRGLRPRWVLLENVPGLLARGMGDVLGELAASGYDAEWDCIPAAAVGAPHQRDRVWVVAYPNDGEPDQRQGKVRPADEWCTTGRPELRAARCSTNGHPGHVADSDGTSRRVAAAVFAGTRLTSLPRPGQTRPGRRDGLDDPWAAEPDVGRVAHGVPARLDRLRGLGNAVVPQVAELIGRRILDAWQGAA